MQTNVVHCGDVAVHIGNTDHLVADIEFTSFTLVGQFGFAGYPGKTRHCLSSLKIDSKLIESREAVKSCQYRLADSRHCNCAKFAGRIMVQSPNPQPVSLYCPRCAKSVPDPLTCGDCS